MRNSKSNLCRRTIAASLAFAAFAAFGAADYRLSVDGVPVTVEKCRVSAMPFNAIWPGHQRPKWQTEDAAFADFDVTRPVCVTVEAPRDFTNVTVRPLSRGIRPTVEGRRISFTIDRPGFFSVEPNSRHGNLHLFANAPERDIPSPKDVKYWFGPGEHEVGRIALGSDETVYLAKGAVVHAMIYALDATNVTVRGRGILEGSRTIRDLTPDGMRHHLLMFERCRGVTVRDVTMRDSPEWSLVTLDSTDIAVENVKTIGMWRYNSDGFDFCNSSRIRVKGCFLRNFDDCLDFKGIGTKAGYWMVTLDPVHYPLHRPYDVTDVRCEDCVIWCDWGGSLQIGIETTADRMAGFVFRNIDVIRASAAPLRIGHIGRAEISDVLFDDIRVEYAAEDDERPVVGTGAYDERYVAKKGRPSGVVDFFIETSPDKAPERPGTARDIAIRNLALFMPPGMETPAIKIKDGDATHRFDNVTVEGFSVNGVPCEPRIVWLKDGARRCMRSCCSRPISSASCAVPRTMLNIPCLSRGVSVR